MLSSRACRSSRSPCSRSSSGSSSSGGRSIRSCAAQVSCILIAFVAGIAIRSGPRGIIAFTVAAVAFGIWLGLRGRGGDDRGDDGPDVPDPPDPDPGPGQRADLPPEVLDPEAFDRARAEWERELPKRG